MSSVASHPEKNIIRVQLNAIEEATAYRRLIEAFEHDRAEIDPGGVQ